MKLLLVLTFTLHVMAAQNTISPVSTSTSVAPGKTVTIDVVSAGTLPMVGAEWAITGPAGTTFTQVVGTQAAAASKTLSCNPSTPPAGVLCLTSGLNTNVIANGKLATYVATVPATLTIGSNITFTVSNTSAADATGSGVSIVGANPLTLAVKVKNDINGDGVVDITDVNIVIGQALTLTACTTGDLNGDGACNWIDVGAVILSALKAPGF